MALGKEYDQLPLGMQLRDQRNCSGARLGVGASMDWLQTVVLALVQGLTEFLPVSSSAT